MDTPNGGSRSRKAAIDQHCRSCIYDPSAPGTWQVAGIVLADAAVNDCELYPFRPTGYGTIPSSVLAYFGAEDRSLRSRAEIRQEYTNIGTRRTSAISNPVGLSGGAQNV